MTPAETQRESLLVGRARSGDPAAFEELVAPHLDGVRRFAYSFVKEWAAADDLSQDAMIKAFRAFPTYRAEAALSTWLLSVTRSVCLDWFKTRQSKARGLERELDLDFADDLESPEELLHNKVNADRLWRAIKKLRVEFRIPLVLFDIEGLSYEEIARVENLRIGTVRSRLSRARAQLVVALNSGEPESSLISGTGESLRSSTRVPEPAE